MIPQRMKLQGGSRGVVLSLRKILISGVLITILTVGGCATYRLLPITSEAVALKLKPPNMNEVRLLADSLKHPLLQKVPFDDRDGLSPDEAAILAVIANPTLRAIRDRRGIAAAQLIQAGILPNPQLSYDLGVPVGGGTQGKVSASGFGLGWDITSLISRSARMDAAGAHVAAVDLEVAWEEWQVAEAARWHVYRLIIAKKRLTTAKQAETSYQQLWEGVKRGVALHLKTALDLSTAETSRQEAHLAVLKAQAVMNQERLALNRTLGFPAERVVVLQKDIPQPMPKGIPSIDDLTADIEKRRLDLLALKLGYQSQEARIRTAVRSQFPKINLGLTEGRDTDKLQTVGMKLNIDIPFFDRNQGHITEERATRKQLFDEYTARLFEAHVDIARLVTAIQATQKQITSIDESLSTVKELAKGYRQAANVGQVEVSFYYEALSSFYKKQIKRIDLEQRMINLGIALEIASAHSFLL